MTWRALLLLPIAAFVLAACAQDDEASLYAEVSAWIPIEKTIFFASRMGCTAALYLVDGAELSATVTQATSLADSVSMMRKDGPVLIDLGDVSPNDISSSISTVDLPEGIGLISSGLGARDCMDETQQLDFYRVLQDPTARMIYDSAQNTLGVWHPELQLLFVGRGDI